MWSKLARLRQRRNDRPGSCELHLRFSVRLFFDQLLSDDTIASSVFYRIEVQISAQNSANAPKRSPCSPAKVTVPISELSYIELHRAFGPAQQHQVVASFVDVMRRVLEPKCTAFERMGAQPERSRIAMIASA